MGSLGCFVSRLLYDFRWGLRTLMVFLLLVGIVGVEGRVRSVAVHGECLVGALRRKKKKEEEDGTKVVVDMVVCFFLVVELNNSQLLDLSAEAA